MYYMEGSEKVVNENSFLNFMAGLLIGSCSIGWYLTNECNNESETMLQNRNRIIDKLREENKR